MGLDVPPTGAIIEYPYLWASQANAGETEGRKDRPVCVTLSVFEEATNAHHLLLLAISSQPPRPGQQAIEVPRMERRRTGLLRYPAAWVVTSEYNYDIAERSFYLEPGAPVIGVFSSTFMRCVATALRSTLMRGLGRVDRDR